MSLNITNVIEEKKKERGVISKILKISLLPVLLVLVLLGHLLIPDQQLLKVNAEYSYFLVILIAFSIVLIVFSIFNEKVLKKIEHSAPFYTALAAFLFVWEFITQKLNLLPMPFFPSPVKIFEAFYTDYAMLLLSFAHSFRLLVVGFLIGSFAGFITGILLGWYKKFRYWVNPFIKFIGPVPATAFIPVVLVVFPNSFSASVFLIALSTWFSVAIQTWTGIASVKEEYFEVAKTLGADEKFLIYRVAIPAAFPSIFIGLFMGLGSSFATLVVAEMLGVKAGLGWYIQWAQGWAEYYKVYTALIVMAALFSLILAGFFKFRNRVLIYQKGEMKW